MRARTGAAIAAHHHHSGKLGRGAVGRPLRLQP